MDHLRVGAVFRAVRLRRRLRQEDLGARVGVSMSTISRIERGHVGPMSLDTLVRVGAGLEIRIDVVPRWRGGELDRMLGAGHAVMHEAVARLFRSSAWTMAPEASFAIYGERGVIDILAFHPPSAALLVAELKTDLVDIQGLIGAVDRYRRLAPVVASQRGWAARTVSTWVVLRSTPANHRRLAAHATVLRSAFPDDGRRVRGWLSRPAGTISALSFLSDSHARTAISASAGVQRVRQARMV